MANKWLTKGNVGHARIVETYLRVSHFKEFQIKQNRIFIKQALENKFLFGQNQI